MKIKFAIFFLFLLSCTFCFARQEQIIEFARAYRTTDSLQKDEILKKSFESLPTFDTLDAFLKASLDNTLENYDIIDSKTTDQFGKSSDNVYFVKSTKGQLLYVIKAFSDPLEPFCRFLPEISSLDFIIQRHLKLSLPVIPLAFGKIKLKGEWFALLLESPAKGQRLKDYVFQIRQQKGKNREYLLEKAEKAFFALGKAFAELNNTADRPITIIQEEFFDNTRVKLAAALSEPTASLLREQLNLDQLKQTVEELIAHMHYIEFPAGYCHGDTNLSNLFYDFQKDKIYFIDVAKLHRSFDAKLCPLADPAKDLTRIKQNLEGKTILAKLNADESNRLYDSLYSGYFSEAQVIPNRCSILFWILDSYLGQLSEFSNVSTSEDQATREFRKKVFDRAVRFFQAIEHQNI